MLKNCVFKGNIDTKKWFASAAIRAVKTMAQTAVSVIAVGSTLEAVDWKLAASSAVVAGKVGKEYGKDKSCNSTRRSQSGRENCQWRQ